MATLSALLACDRTAKVIIISGQGERENALQAVGAGAYDFLCKPVNVEELKFTLQRCCHVAGLEREYRQMQQMLPDTAFEGMVGASPRMEEVFASIRKVAASSAPVLILGESGTGKEMAALAVHRRSRCRNGPFMAINCSAIPESLMESELFGHEKGAFTGASTQRKGLIESAAGGTLFLDEIGELAAPIQVKLLRFLQEKTFQRVGGRQEIQSDVRVVAATNAELKALVKQGAFREDLYFRLAVVCLNLPALRDRGDDVLLLAREFLSRFATQNQRRGLTFAPETLRAMLRQPWRGNVRELQNRVQRAVIMADGKRILPGDLDFEESPDTQATLTLKAARENVERQLVQRALVRNQGRITGAAAELGISRPTMYELMEKLGMPKE
jgi:two-component system NtrC family response regulator